MGLSFAWVGWTLLVVFLTFVLAGHRPLQRWRFRRFPGPPPEWYFGNLGEMQKLGTYKFHQLCSQKYGSIFKIWGATGPNLVVTSPALVRSVLLHNHNRAVVPTLITYSSKDKDFEGALILISRDEKWRSIRQAWTPLFFTGSLEAYSALMNECASLLISQLHAAAEGGQAVDLWSMIGDMTINVIGSAAFGVDFKTQANLAALSSHEQEEVEQLRVAVQTMFSNAIGVSTTNWFWLVLFVPSFMMPVVRWLALTFPDARMKRTLQARHAMISIAKGVVADHRRYMTAKAAEGGDAHAAPNGGVNAQVKLAPARGQEASGKGAQQGAGLRKGVAPGSFIDLLVQAADRSSGRKFTDSEIAAQAFTSILAGYETSANAMAFTVHCLSANPDKQARLLMEVDAFGQRTPSYSDLEEGFPYLDAVLKESMRLYPPATFAVREAAQDQELAGYRIRKGTFLATSIWTMHRDESLWHDAESFIPERWLDDTPEAVGRNDHAFAPFGDGPRKCVAFRFALEEAKITLIHLYQQFVFKLEPGQVPLQLRHTITLSPKDGVRVTIHPRKSPHANGGPQ